MRCYIARYYEKNRGWGYKNIRIKRREREEWAKLIQAFLDTIYPDLTKTKIWWQIMFPLAQNSAQRHECDMAVKRSINICNMNLD